MQKALCEYAEGLFVATVGTIVLLDRVLRWLAGELGMKPEHLRLAVWVVSLAGAICLFFLINKN